MICTMLSATMAWADGHTQFLGLSLGMQPRQMMEELQNKGLRQEDSYKLTGRVAGLDVVLSVKPNKDSTGISHMLLTTGEQQGETQRDDYAQLMRWMRHHYGAPVWESTVRGHAFARWYVGYDRDIVMIATSKPSVDVWFYDNHSQRNIDYYSILKYCERNPSDDVPNLTARECVTWRSTAPKVAVKKSAKGRQRVRKAVTKRQRTKAHSKRRRRR